MMLKILLKLTKCLKSLSGAVLSRSEKSSNGLWLLEGKSFVAVAMAKICQKNESVWF